MDRIRLTALLTYGGAIPFLAGALAHVTGIGGENAANLLSYWAFAILIFMAGTLWGIAIAFPQAIRPSLFLASNAVVLATIAALWFVPINQAFLLFAIGFGALLWLDRQAHRAGATDSAYWTLRQRVTLIVVASLVVVALLPPGIVAVSR